MLPASLAACVPLFMATATSACASAGASLVPSPVMATRRPWACCSRISASLVSGVASAMKSSTPASAAMEAAVRRLSPVIITVLMPIWRSSAKRSRMPALTMSFSSTTPSTRSLSDTTSGVPPLRATSSTAADTASGNLPASSVTCVRIASAAPLRIWRATPSCSTLMPLMRVCAEKATYTGCVLASAASSIEASPSWRASVTMLRPSGVSSANDDSQAASASALGVTPGAGRKRDA